MSLQEVYSVETDYIANKKNNLSISNSQNVSSLRREILPAEDHIENG